MRFSGLLLIVALSCSNGVFGQTDPLGSKWQKALDLDSLGKHSQALKLLDGLVKEPKYAYKAHMLRSAIYFDHMERLEDAFTEIEMAMQDQPDSIAPYVNRSGFYLSMRMPDRALLDLRSAMAKTRTASDSVTVLLNMSSALSMMRQFDKSIQALDQALLIEPDNWGVLSNKAAALDDVDREEEARSIYLRLHEMKPEEPVILNNLGFNASGRGDHSEAQLWFQKALVLAPDDPVVLNNLSYSQLMTGDTDNALRSVSKSIELYPANSYAFRNLGLILLARGDKEAACDAFENALAKGFTPRYGPEVKDLRKEHCH